MSVNLRYPNITASTEKEQLAQIKSYLHQLVEQLNYALPTIGEGKPAQTVNVQGEEMSYYELRSLIISTTERLKEQYEELYQQLEIDHVTEEGRAEGWTYKKWKSGTYEMFGEFTVTTTTICTDMGSMFCSEELSLPTPFAIDRAIVSGSADDLFLVASGGRASVDADTNISFVLLRPFSFNANLEIIVRLHVTGTYHQGGTE